MYFKSYCLGGSTEDWANRVIYQVFTDRFDKSKSNTVPCSDLTKYCGGSFEGTINRLDYLLELGIDAIWISPVVANIMNGYHGYWALDLYEINDHFGTKDDLKDLIKEAHSRGIYVMVDVVANHMGQNMEDLPYLNPFNDTKYYHDCGCVDNDCCPDSCWVEDYNNHAQMQHCQLYGLPDLNQDVSFVADTLNNWIQSLVKEYDFDGIRIDTVSYVKSEFWGHFTKSSGVFNIGEVSSPDAEFCASFVNDNSLASVFHYPLYYAIINSFAYKMSFQTLSNALVASKAAFSSSKINSLGIFVENHDVPRFLYLRNDIQASKNAILFVCTTAGIPIIYYGQDQGYHGGSSDYANREPLWTSGFPTSESYENMFTFIQTVLKYRKEARLYTFDPIEVVADDSMYAFSRGDAFVALTNVGGGSPSSIKKTVSGWGVQYVAGTVVCNIFSPSTDCIKIQENYTIDIYLNDGECKLFLPKKYFM